MMVNECPVCRHPINAFVVMSRRSAWTCHTCGSLLRMDKNRRYLALLPFACIVLVAVTFMSLAGWTKFAVILVAVVAWLPCFLLFDRAIVLERRGFWCQDCGYDLRGQVDPHCPECGREFDSNETAQMELPDPTRLVQGQERKRGCLGLILLIALTVALTVSVILPFAVYRRAKSRSVPPAPTQASTTVPNESVDQP